MFREKVILTHNYYVETGYYDDENIFIYHSFDDEPSCIWYDGTKQWCDNDEQYWFIENKKYFIIDDVYENYKDKIIITKEDISQLLTDNNIDFIFVDFCVFLILDDSDRNEVILKYG